MIENTTYNCGLLKSLNSPKTLADFSPTRRQLKNNRIERVKIKSYEEEIKMGGIASACNSSYKKLAFKWLILPSCFCSSAVYAETSALRKSQLSVAAKRYKQMPGKIIRTRIEFSGLEFLLNFKLDF